MFMIKQRAIPQAVGISAANTLHFILPVSFFMVISVVEHGQCISEKVIVHIAVMGVQPFAINNSFIMERLAASLSVPEDM